MTKKRFLDADVLKGIMIILMVFGHLPRVGSFSEELNQLVDFIYMSSFTTL